MQEVVRRQGSIHIIKDRLFYIQNVYTKKPTELWAFQLR